MKKVFAPSIFALLSVACLVFVNFGCSVKEVKPDPETIASAKPQESIFTIIELEDAEYPTVEASIYLPFRVRSKQHRRDFRKTRVCHDRKAPTRH